MALQQKTKRGGGAPAAARPVRMRHLTVLDLARAGTTATCANDSTRNPPMTSPPVLPRCIPPDYLKQPHPIRVPCTMMPIPCSTPCKCDATHPHLNPSRPSCSTPCKCDATHPQEVPSDHPPHLPLQPVALPPIPLVRLMLPSARAGGHFSTALHAEVCTWPPCDRSARRPRAPVRRSRAPQAVLCVSSCLSISDRRRRVGFRGWSGDWSAVRRLVGLSSIRRSVCVSHAVTVNALSVGARAPALPPLSASASAPPTDRPLVPAAPTQRPTSAGGTDAAAH